MVLKGGIFFQQVIIIDAGKISCCKAANMMCEITEINQINNNSKTGGVRRYVHVRVRLQI